MFHITFLAFMSFIILRDHQSLADPHHPCPVSVGENDCSDVAAEALGGAVKPSGKYHLFVGAGKRGLWAYCDMETDGGGWTVIQRRSGPEVDFYRAWKEYEQGFGDPDDDHWIGNTYLHSITVNKRYVLRIELTDWDNKSYYAEYSNFVVGGAGCDYTLESVGAYCGDCGDSLTDHTGMKFTAKDYDKDQSSEYNCAEVWHGAWWYNNCFRSNLNGRYITNGIVTGYDGGINWNTGKGASYSYKKVEMKIRPYNY